MSKLSNKFIRTETEEKIKLKVSSAAKQVKDSGPEACAPDSLVWPCFPHLNIEDHETGKCELTK
jgi:hypothetical protein